MAKGFRKILIANRGEIAVRIIRACRDMGISPVAVYSEVDADALHVRMADEAYCVGKAPSSESYLRTDAILQAARRSGADAIHPGYGFLAENASFASACAEAGRVFIGPSPDSIRLMGDKLAARRAMIRAGVPIVPGTEAAASTVEEALQAARRIGFPVMVKASSGGGGKGLRVVREESRLPSVFETAGSEAQSSFNDATVYLEKYLEKPRHIEVQLMGDRHGRLFYLGERECSIQRRHQKLIEECPSPSVTTKLRRRLGEAALAAGRAVDYFNAGTVEFLVDPQGPPDDWNFYFLEMNTRLQVEHPVTEMATGMDLVRDQIRVAAGEKLPYRQEQISLTGAAMECRIYAEDPAQNFFPSPGRIDTLIEPSGPGIRNDPGVYEGFSIPLHYDPLISKLVSWGSERAEAIQRMKRALGEYRIGGVRTTIPFYQRLLDHPAFLRGDLHTHFVEAHRLDRPDFDPDPEEELLAVAAAALEEYLAESFTGPPRPVRRSGWKESFRGDWH